MPHYKLNLYSEFSFLGTNKTIQDYMAGLESYDLLNSSDNSLSIPSKDEYWGSYPKRDAE